MEKGDEQSRGVSWEGDRYPTNSWSQIDHTLRKGTGLENTGLSLGVWRRGEVTEWSVPSSGWGV